MSSFAELNDAFRPLINSLGFSFFACVESEAAAPEPGLNILFGEPDVAFYDYYKEAGLADVDPCLRHMLSSAEPAFLTDLPCVRNDEPDLHFLAQFRKFGHIDCFICPIHLPEGRVRAVIMPSRFGRVQADVTVAAGALAMGFHAAGAKLLRRTTLAKPSTATLRPRQLECLYWAQQGKSSADTGRILGISPRTVDEHIGHACRALGVRTRIQAVARAVMLGIL